MLRYKVIASDEFGGDIIVEVSELQGATYPLSHYAVMPNGHIHPLIETKDVVKAYIKQVGIDNIESIRAVPIIDGEEYENMASEWLWGEGDWSNYPTEQEVLC